MSTGTRPKSVIKDLSMGAINCSSETTAVNTVTKTTQDATVSKRGMWFEPVREIMELIVLRKLILQKHMHSHPVGLGVWFLVGPFVYFHTLCVRTMKPLARLCGCAGSSEPSLVAYVISTIILWAGSFSCIIPSLSVGYTQGPYIRLIYRI